MGRGILGPQIESIPLGNGNAIKLKDASNVPGVVCEVHDLKTEEILATLVALMARPGGLDACPDCIARVTALAKEKR